MKRGFTLIELLIVVAIIAILAAIAVPNFLEAQTRSRVSRAQNDLRTVAMAMESYRVDNNGYPAPRKDVKWLLPTLSGDPTDVRLLSTPISYINSFPRDIFRQMAGQPGADYRIYALSYIARTTYPFYYRSFSEYPRTAWMTWSLGPDLLTNCGGWFPQKVCEANEGANPPAVGIDGNGNWITSAHSYGGMRYDPTNGTTSWGDIYRWEGEAQWRLN